MTTTELRKLAIYFVNKGYIDADSIRYSDSLYNASDEERDECIEYVDEIIRHGLENFEIELKRELSLKEFWEKYIVFQDSNVKMIPTPELTDVQKNLLKDWQTMIDSGYKLIIHPGIHPTGGFFWKKVEEIENFEKNKK